MLIGETILLPLLFILVKSGAGFIITNFCDFILALRSSGALGRSRTCISHLRTVAFYPLNYESKNCILLKDYNTKTSYDRMVKGMLNTFVGVIPLLSSV